MDIRYMISIIISIKMKYWYMEYVVLVVLVEGNFYILLDGFYFIIILIR